MRKKMENLKIVKIKRKRTEEPVELLVFKKPFKKSEREEKVEDLFQNLTLERSKISNAKGATLEEKNTEENVQVFRRISSLEEEKLSKEDLVQLFKQKREISLKDKDLQTMLDKRKEGK